MNSNTPRKGFVVTAIVVGGALASLVAARAAFDRPVVVPTNPVVAEARRLREIESLAHLHCQTFVSRRLKSPTTARFPSAQITTPEGDLTYSVSSFVDAQNGFGATIRTGWSCRVHYSGGAPAAIRNWDVVAVEIR